MGDLQKEKLCFTREPVYQSARRKVVSTGLAREDGKWPEVTVISVEETGSNIDFFFAIPATRTATGTVIRVYVVAEEIRTLVKEFLLENVPTTTSDDGSTVTGFVGVRGHPSLRWDVALASNAAGTLAEGIYSAIVWGTESTPDVVGEDGSVGITPGALPAHHALLMGWDSATSSWRPLSNAGGTGLRSAVVGTHTIVDGEVPPIANTVQSQSFGMVFDETNNRWWELRGNSQGFAYATLAAEDFDSGTGSTDLNCTAGGALFMQPGLPIAAASTQDPHDVYDVVNTKLVKSGAGKVLGITANNNSAANLYFCIVNKTGAAPANGDTVRTAWLVPASGCVSRELMRPRPCTTGIGWAWSTTANVVTLAAAPGSAEVAYV